jgi:hypothetical protein
MTRATNSCRVVVSFSSQISPLLGSVSGSTMGVAPAGGESSRPTQRPGSRFGGGNSRLTGENRELLASHAGVVLRDRGEHDALGGVATASTVEVIIASSEGGIPPPWAARWQVGL